MALRKPMKLKALLYKGDGHGPCPGSRNGKHMGSETPRTGRYCRSRPSLALRRQLDANPPRQSRSTAKASPARPINPIPNSANPRRLTRSLNRDSLSFSGWPGSPYIGARASPRTIASASEQRETRPRRQRRPRQDAPRSPSRVPAASRLHQPAPEHGRDRLSLGS